MSGSSIEGSNTSIAWLRAVEHLLNCGGECPNLMVQIANPTQVEAPIHAAYEQLLSRHDLLTLKQVIYTIFPLSLYRQVGKDPTKLFERYNRSGGIYDRLRRRYPRKFGWGSYFRRMTCYPAVDNQGHIVTMNQLEDVLDMLKERERVYKAAYTISIQIPGTDGRRIRGGPCLNYVALQLRQPKVLHMLAVFRSHDFIQRAYGNYLSLGYLMEFLCEQTGYTMGTLGCLSSYASLSDLAGHDSWPRTAELQILVERVK
jgi:hypothetical protein